MTNEDQEREPYIKPELTNLGSMKEVTKNYTWTCSIGCGGDV